MFSFAPGRFDRTRQVVLVTIVGVVAVISGGLTPTASAYPGPVDRDCPASGPCETVIQAADGNTYYADNLGGGHGFVVPVGPDGQPGDTIEVSASERQVALTRAQPGRRLALWGEDLSKTGIFGTGSSADVPVNVVNINGNGYIEFAADLGRGRPAQIVFQVIGGDGQVYQSSRFDRDESRLQQPYKDYLLFTSALNTAASRLRALLAGVGGITSLAAATLITGAESKAFTEANVITAAAAIGSVAITGIIQLYNSWRDVDGARNNLINQFNIVNAAAGRGSVPIPLVAFGGIRAQRVSQNSFHSFRLP